MSNILLIEPDAVLGGIYSCALMHAGHAVLLQTHAQTSIESLDSGAQPDLIVLEIQLSDHNGVEFIHELRSYTDLSHIPIIILTHIPLEEVKLSEQTLERLNIRSVLYKPHIRLATLSQLVQEHAG